MADGSILLPSGLPSCKHPKPGAGLWASESFPKKAKLSEMNFLKINRTVVAECILAERDNTEYSTLVVGRRGLTHKEEFLFGSISGKIVRTAKNCTVWVVQ